MGVYMATNGYYYIRQQINGKEIKFSLRTKDPEFAAKMYEKFLEKLISNQIEGRLEQTNAKVQFERGIDCPRAVSLTEPYRQYMKLAELKNLAESSMNSKKRCFRIITEELKFRTYSELVRRIHEFLEFIDHYSGDTKRKFITELKTFLHWSIKQGHFDDLNYNRLEFPNYKTKVRNIIIDKEDFRLIYDHLQKEGDIDHLMYLKTLYNTASRPSEIIDLKYGDFDFKNRRIVIFQNKTQKHKTVYLKQDFLDELSKYAEQRKLKKNDYLFDGHKHYKGKKNEYYGKKFKRIKTKLNLNPKYTLYAIRHTYGTRAALVAGSKFTANQLGDTVETANKHYVNIEKSDMINAVEGI